NSLASNELRGWIDALKLRDDFIKIDPASREYKIDSKFFTKHSVNRLEGKFLFLKDLGIPITKSFYSKFSKADKKHFNDAVFSLYSFLKESEAIPFNLAAKLKVGGPLKTISGLFVKYSNNELDSTY